MQALHCSLNGLMTSVLETSLLAELTTVQLEKPSAHEANTGARWTGHCGAKIHHHELCALPRMYNHFSTLVRFDVSMFQHKSR